jgi:hypothetical protein
MKLAISNDRRRYSLAPLETLGMRTGSQLVTLLRIAPSGTMGSGITPTIHLERTRYIVLKNGALRVEGV